MTKEAGGRLADYDGIWRKSRKNWYFPRMPKAKYVEDPKTEDGLKDEIRQALEKEIGFAVLNDTQIYISIPNCLKYVEGTQSKDDLENFIQGVTDHEVGHYSIHPYTFANYMVMIDKAAKGLENRKAFQKGGDLAGIKYQVAANLTNILSDIVVNTHAVDRGNESIPFIYDRMKAKNEKDGNKGSKIWDIYMRTYEKLWNMDGRYLVKDKLSQDLERAAQEVHDTLDGCNLYSAKNHEWMAYTFATILAPYAETDPQSANQAGQSTEGDPSGSGGGGAPQPSDEEQDPDQEKQQSGDGTSGGENGDEQDQKAGEGDQSGDQEGETREGGDKETDQQKRMKSRQKYKSVAKKIGDKDRYKELRAGLGDPYAGDSEHEADRAYYKDLADSYTIKYAPSRKKQSANYPYSPQKWTPSDPISDLDVLYSATLGGKLIPGVTTYKWQKKGDDPVKDGTGPPDLLLMLDSSGSMTNPIDGTSVAVLSAYVAAYSALNVGAKVGVINFSNKCTVQDFTNDGMKVEEMLVKYQKGGTDMPTQEINDLVEKNPNPVQMILISDTEISNAKKGYDHLRQAVQYKPLNRGAVFMIEDSGRSRSNESTVKELESAGIELFHVEKEADLLNLVIGKTNSVYGGGTSG